MTLGFGFFFFLAFISLIVYSTKPNKDRTRIYIVIFVLLGVVAMLVTGKVKSLDIFIINPFYLIPIIVFVVYLIVSVDKMKLEKGKIFAQQESYWGVTPEEILEKYSDRIVKKKGRNEIKDIPIEYFFRINEKGEKVLNTIKYADIKRYGKFTLLKDLTYFTSKDVSKLHSIIYNAILELKEEYELDIDLNKLLKENKNILEFFILDIWEKLAKDEPIGIATLEIYTTKDRDYDLIGAMDSVIGKNAQLYGLELLAHYEYFKGRIPGIFDEDDE